MWRYFCDLDTQCHIPISGVSLAVAINLKICAPPPYCYFTFHSKRFILKNACFSNVWCIIMLNLRAPIFNVACVVRLPPIQVGSSTILLKLLKSRNWDGCQLFQMLYTGLFISPSGTSELDCATTKTDTAERSISIGRETLEVFFCTRSLGVLADSTARG